MTPRAGREPPIERTASAEVRRLLHDLHRRGEFEAAAHVRAILERLEARA